MRRSGHKFGVHAYQEAAILTLLSSPPLGTWWSTGASNISAKIGDTLDPWGMPRRASARYWSRETPPWSVSAAPLDEKVVVWWRDSLGTILRCRESRRTGRAAAPGIAGQPSAVRAAYDVIHYRFLRFFSAVRSFFSAVRSA